MFNQDAVDPTYIGNLSNANDGGTLDDSEEDEELCEFHIGKRFSDLTQISADRRVPSETYGEHVLRYLRTLTAYNTAAKAVIRELRRLPAPTVSVVHVPDNSKTAKEDINQRQSAIFEELKVKISSRRTNSATAALWLQAHSNLPNRGHRVHAEAALMALAYHAKHEKAEAARNNLSADLVELFSVCLVAPGSW